MMVCRRHRNEKPEGSKATGEQALKAQNSAKITVFTCHFY
jgi:hypothetical protein